METDIIRSSRLNHLQNLGFSRTVPVKRCPIILSPKCPWQSPQSPLSRLSPQTEYPECEHEEKGQAHQDGS